MYSEEKGIKKRFKKIYIEITNICNLNCEFCISNNRRQEMMTLNNFEIILQKISPYTDYIYLHVKGEPLLHPNLKEILQLSSKYNILVNITTNGILLSKQLEVLLNSTSVRQINISLHSIKQNSNLNIDENMYLSDVINCANEIHKSIGSYISYRIWDINDMKKDNSKTIYLLEKIYNISDLYETVKAKSSVELQKGIYLNVDNVFQWPSMEHDIVSKNGTCYGLIDQIAILVDGTVVPCCLDQQGDINLGDIFNDTLENILNKDDVKDILIGFRNNKLVKPLCQRCDFRVNKRK